MLKRIKTPLLHDTAWTVLKLKKTWQLSPAMAMLSQAPRGRVSNDCSIHKNKCKFLSFRTNRLDPDLGCTLIESAFVVL